MKALSRTLTRLSACLAAPLLCARLAASALPAAAAEFSASQTGEIGADRARLSRHTIPKSCATRWSSSIGAKRPSRRPRARRCITTRPAQLFSSPHQAVVGNPNGKVTLVEFFDYNCGYCKKSLDDLAKLIKEDPNLRVVLKDFPVLGPGSVEAAQVAWRVRNQFNGDKFWAFHQKLLLTRGPVGKAQALAVAKDMGADMDKLDRDMASPDVKAGIQEVMQIADGLNLTGTPSWVVGRDVVVGAVGYDELKGKIDNVAKCGKAVCS